MDDDYDPVSLCPRCGARMKTDTDGDGVMTMSYEFCEDCGEADYGEPVRVTESLLAFARREGLPPYDQPPSPPGDHAASQGQAEDPVPQGPARPG